VAEPSDLFATLVGEAVSAVSFVMDYVEFHFNGQIIRALSSPILETKTGRFQFPGTGSRDALCSLIEDTVTGVQVAEEGEMGSVVYCGIKETGARSMLYTLRATPKPAGSG
jgi:hypothetical protein